MKKLLFSLAAIVALVATSCVQADVEDINLGGNEGVVTFVIKTDALGSRTINDGEKATALSYGIYDKDWTLIKTDTATMKGLATTLELRLVKNKTYNFAFWAQNSGVDCYALDFAGKTLTVNYANRTANNDNYDAFYGTTTVTVDNGAVNKPVELKRPFAQINFAAADTALAVDAGYNVAAATTKFETVAYTQMSLEDGNVIGEAVPVTFTATTNPEEALKIKDGTEYDWLAMNYILWKAEEYSLSTCEMTVSLDGQSDITISYPNAPAKRNWRTNLVGNLLTEAAVIKVEINPMPENEYNLGFEVSNGVAQVTNEQGLAKVAELINEGSLPADTDIVLNGDLDLAELAALFRSEEVSNWTPIGTSEKPYTGTFDGNGYTIRNLVINGGSNSNIGFFGVTHDGEIKNLTIENAKVSGRLNVGVVAGEPYTTKYTNITVKGHIEVNGMAYVGAVGGKNAYADWTNITVNADETSYVKAHSIENGTAYRTYVGGVCGFNGEGGHTFKNITSNIDVKGSTCDVGGLFGIAHYGNKFENCVCTGDVEIYAAEEADEAQEIGGIAGVWHNETGTTVTFTDCSFTGNLSTNIEGVEFYYGGLVGKPYSATGTGKIYLNGGHTVASAAELQRFLDAATGEATVNLGATIVGEVTAVQKQGVKVTINGLGNTFNGVIKAHSNSNHYADAALTINNVNFVTSTASINCIEALENGSKRYSSNITVENCTFTATGEAVNTSVGVQIKSSKNAKVLNCTATNMHSLLQAQSCDETVKVENCTINGKNGVAFKQVKAATVEGTTITALEYGVRFDGNTDNYGIVVKNNNISAVQPFIVRKMTGKNNTITLEGENTLTTEADYQIVITNGSDDAAYVKPTGTYTLTGADAYTVYPGTTVVNNAVEFIAAVNNVDEDGTIIIAANFDFTDEEGGRTNNGGWWDGLGYSGDKSFTIDLNGKTIGNANGVLNDYLFWFKNDGAKASTITIKNGTLDAGTTAYCALCTASSGSQPLTINLENVTLINNKSDGSTIKARTALTTVNLKNGTKVIGKNSYLGIESWKATVNIYEGAEIYMNGTTSYNGCLVGVSGNGVINVYGGYGKGVKGGFIAMTSGGTINVYGGEWIANTDGTIGNNSNLYVLTAQSNSNEPGFAGASVINVTGGTFRGGMDAWVLNNIPGEAAGLNISGGNYNANPSRYVVAGKTATETNGIWTVE